MSDYDGSDDPSNVIDFARRTGQTGFNLTPTTTMAPVIPPPPTAPPAPTGAGTRTGRRSPLDALTALPTPGLALPPVPAPAPGPQPGHVPATFHNDPDNDDGPGSPAGLGALSMAATLAVAIACLRGTHTVLSTWWENRQTRHAETAQLREARFKHQLAMQQAGHSQQQAAAKHSATMQGIGAKGAQQRAKKVPSSSEFGRKSLGRSGSGPGGSSGGRGGGAGRSGGSSAGSKKPGSGSSSHTNGLGSKGRGKNNSSLFGSGSPKKKDGSNSRSPGGLKKSPHRGSQGGSKGLLNKRTKQAGGGKTLSPKNNSSGSGGTSLAGALKKDTQKAAARRWKKRQKRGLNNPAVWGNSPKNHKNAPKNSPKNSPKKGPGQAGKNTPNAKNRKARKVQAQAAGANRKKLNQALWHDWKKAAAGRWKKRQRKAGHVPPVWKAGGQRKNKPGPQQAAPGGPTSTNTPPKTPKPNLKKNKQGGKQNAGRWAKTQAWARKKAAKGGRFPGGIPDPQRQAAGQSAPNPGQQQAPGRHAASGAPGTGRKRRSPFQNAAQASAQAAGTTYTFDPRIWADDDNDFTARPQAAGALTAGTPQLPAAPGTYPPRPGTTKPNPPIAMPPTTGPIDPRIKEHHRMATRSTAVQAVGRQMDAQHATEITLDEACDGLDQLTEDSFTAHDQCARLADKAVSLRDTWIQFAEHCATQNNLIGPLFTGASVRFAESMDLVARMALEMKASSLEAAELTEVASNDMNDAYRPYNTATADAGLTTPSAPAHNDV